jgi:uncharacterized protein (TIGR02996 family)
MTTEADFQAALDANPNDWQTRLVFADWLDEHGDPRAAGYRALGALRRTPFPWRNPPDADGVLRWLYHNGTGTYNGRPIPDDHRLPADWIGAISKDGRTQPLIMCYDVGDGTPLPRSAMEDAAARAFLKLPDKRRATLLAGKLRRHK